jgi:hypothetical protein
MSTPHLPCPSEDCERWLASTSALNKHIRASHPSRSSPPCSPLSIRSSSQDTQPHLSPDPQPPSPYSPATSSSRLPASLPELRLDNFDNSYYDIVMMGSDSDNSSSPPPSETESESESESESKSESESESDFESDFESESESESRAPPPTAGPELDARPSKVFHPQLNGVLYPFYLTLS